MSNNCKKEVIDMLSSILDDHKQNSNGNKDIRIVILQRGWVMVGSYNRIDNDCFLTNCFTIRRWGTTKGLGELASNGPLSNTILDKQADTEFHILTVIASIKCDNDKW